MDINFSWRPYFLFLIVLCFGHVCWLYCCWWQSFVGFHNNKEFEFEFEDHILLLLLSILERYPSINHLSIANKKYSTRLIKFTCFSQTMKGATYYRSNILQINLKEDSISVFVFLKCYNSRYDLLDIYI